MAQPLLFGDSHARNVAMTRGDGTFELDGWHITAVGGASAYGLTNCSSRTGARNKIIETLDTFNEINKDIYLMFGEVDCTNHIVRGSSATDSLSRYRDFVYELFGRDDVMSVYTCAVYPRTSIFNCEGKSALEHKGVIESWNANIVDPVDTYSPLLGHDGFLLNDLAHSSVDTGERHLSKMGSAVVFDILKMHHSQHR